MNYLQVSIGIELLFASSVIQVIDLSYNKINTFDGLDHPLLKCLNLNYNKLSNLDTMLMDTFTNLQVLELRSNQFTSLKVRSTVESRPRAEWYRESSLDFQSPFDFILNNILLLV